MNEEIRLLLKMILAEEEANQASEKDLKKKEAPQVPKTDDKETEKPSVEAKRMSKAEIQREKDRNTVRKDLYDDHKGNVAKNR